jgi:hypothetical protein
MLALVILLESHLRRVDHEQEHEHDYGDGLKAS